jgi:hypothetical protein
VPIGGAPPRPRGPPYKELARNFLVDLAAVRIRSRRFLPLMTNYYLTKRCNLRCRELSICWRRSARAIPH